VALVGWAGVVVPDARVSMWMSPTACSIAHAALIGTGSVETSMAVSPSMWAWKSARAVTAPMGGSARGGYPLPLPGWGWGVRGLDRVRADPRKPAPNVPQQVLLLLRTIHLIAAEFARPDDGWPTRGDHDRRRRHDVAVFLRDLLRWNRHPALIEPLAILPRVECHAGRPEMREAPRGIDPHARHLRGGARGAGGVGAAPSVALAPAAKLLRWRDRGRCREFRASAARRRIRHRDEFRAGGVTVPRPPRIARASDRRHPDDDDPLDPAGTSQLELVECHAASRIRVIGPGIRPGRERDGDDPSGPPRR